MAYVLVQHSVENYDKWRPEFDAHEPVRRDGGSQGSIVFRNVDDPNQITVLFEWDALENARTFTDSSNLREAMQRAGVTGPPSVYFLEEVDRPSA